MHPFSDHRTSPIPHRIRNTKNESVLFTYRKWEKSQSPSSKARHTHKTRIIQQALDKHSDKDVL